MKIVIENKIPFIAGRPEAAGAETVYAGPEEFTAESVRDADAIVVRTRTRVGRELLEGSRCRLAVTATIGTDHIDKAWCAANGVAVANAPGCNAPAVAQWVMAAIDAIDPDRDVTTLTLGIVGAGHVGSIVEQWGRAMGMRVLVCDPPRQRAEGDDTMVDLDTIAAESDIITFHTPLTAEGPDATHHIAGRRFFSHCLRRPAVLNAARGAVVDTPALIDALRRGLVGAAAIDCWEGEPDINLELLNLAAVATPHIAGYSLEGKQRAADMAMDALTRLPGMKPAGHVGPPSGAAAVDDIKRVAESYDIMADDRALRACPEAFEALRNTYNYRHETKC